MAAPGKMANLSRFAHPKNPYKNGLGDLNSLAQEDADFCKVAKQHPESGKVVADWKDRTYTKQLMRAIIKRDFGLDLRTPDDSLAPALTNKLNYLLLIQDLASTNGIPVERIKGIDIGTGPALYFAAIANKHFKWKMSATEANESDFVMARDNIAKNALDVELFKVADKSTIFCMTDKDYFFSMCNPPFYEKNGDRRSRSEYDGVDAGRSHEIEYDGGEVEFVSKMIQESEGVREKIQVFTSLLGHKKNLAPLKVKLSSMSSVKGFSVRELCQGRTMRWVLIWTYHSNIKIDPPNVRAAAKTLEKSKQPITFQVQANSMSFSLFSEKLKEWMASINVQVSKEGKKSDDACYMRLKTNRTDWRGQRAKRRAEEKEPQTKRAKLENDDISGPLQLDCQLYLQLQPGSVIALQFVYLSGEAGKSGMAELVQSAKNQLKNC